MVRKRKKSKRQQSRVYHARASAADLKHVVGMLTMAAPAIEAVGNVNRAIQLGLIHADRQSLEMLRDAVPMSRGGRLEHPDADADWEKGVREAVANRGLDLEAMRQAYSRLPE